MTAVGLAGAAGAAPGDEGFGLVGAEALDNKTIELEFSAPLHPEVSELVTGNPNYLRNYLRVAGGGTGSDAALDGDPLTTVDGSATWTVDVVDSSSIRIVLGSGATLQDRDYEVWLDGDGHGLGSDLRLRSATGAELDGVVTERVRFAGATTAPALAAVDSATRIDDRTLRVEFGAPILSGMPIARAAATGIRVVAGGTTISPTYTQAVASSDRRVWDLTFAEPVPAGSATLSIDGAQHGLTTAAGRLSTTIQHSVDGGGGEYAAPAISSAVIDQERRTLRISFNHKILTVNAGESGVPVKETNTGVSGTTLTADEVRQILDIEGSAIKENVDTGVSGAVRPVSAVLADDTAYFDGPGHLVVTLPAEYRFVRGSAGSVTLRDGAVTDVAQVTSGTGQAAVATVAPDGALPLPDTDYDPTSSDFLAIDADSSVTFRHNEADFTDAANGDYSVRRENVKDRLVDEEVPAIVVENKYIEATFVPEYGGRLLQLIYKPTGNDLLYSNPTGTQYGFTSTAPGQAGNSPFYWNWLMVWGGVFPTLSEAEHGKYWFMPWDYEITETADRVDITMTKRDTLDYGDKPSRYVHGATQIEAEVVYTVYKTSPAVDMTVSLHNPGDTDTSYEYWTCTTFAPGADTFSGSPTMDIVTNVEEVQYDSAYRWMGQVEEPANPETPNDRYVKLDKLKKMSEWTSSGIAYGQDLATLPQNNFWGVVNHENREGIVRVGDNTKTPGMKFWEWGQNASFDTNIFRPGSSARPYIELWAGASGRFFEPAVLAPRSTITWTETYMPTLGLADVTNATTDGAAHVRFEQVDGSVVAYGNVFTTRVGQQVTAQLVDEATGEVLTEKTFRGDALVSEQLVAAVAGQSTVVLVLKDGDGTTLLTAQATDTESVEATPPGTVPSEPAADYQNISTTVGPTGGLSISVADHDVVLPAPELSPTSAVLATSGQLNPVTVVDLRASNPGWNLVGQLSDFAGPDGLVLDAKYLGLAPAVLSASDGQQVTAGPVVPPSEPGLGGSTRLSTGLPGAGRGTAVIGGDLDLRIPTSTAPGTYVATLTLTAI